MKPGWVLSSQGGRLVLLVLGLVLAARFLLPSNSATATVVYVQQDGDAGSRTRPPPFFFLSNDLRDFVVANVKLARSFNPQTSIYLVTSVNQVLARPNEVADILSLPDIHLKFIEHYLIEGSDAAAFAEHFVAHCVNAYAFSLFNFQRFFILRDIARQESLQRLWQIDFDQALFADVSELALKAQSDLVLLNPTSTHFSLWKLPALDHFCRFMVDFYMRPAAAQEADYWSYGQRLNATYAQWSDMFMLHNFVNTQRHNTSTHMLLQEFAGEPITQYPMPGHYRPGYEEWLGLENLGLLIGWNCNAEDFQRLISWQNDPQGRQVPLYNGTVMKGLHFQGYYCKRIEPQVLQSLLPKPAATVQPVGSM